MMGSDATKSATTTESAAATATASLSARTDAAPVTAFADRLDAVLRATGSLVCVGLDPRPERTRVEDLEDFCRRVIDATADYAAAFKPNSAFFEVHGGKGFDILARVIEAIPNERVALLDAKRGDIGSTAEAYAAAVFGTLGADAVTVSPYLGGDSLAPFLADPAKGAFVLCHTSNPGAGDLQHLTVHTEGAAEMREELFLRVARRAVGWNGARNVGLVVGATFPKALQQVREAAPQLPILLPGVGAQQGDVAGAVKAGVDGNGRGLLVSSSRGIIYADDPARAARELRDQVNAVRGGPVGAEV